MRRALLILALVAAVGAAAQAVERFPLPDFPQGYHLPQTTTPAARNAALPWVDLAVLAASLGAGAYLGIVRRSRAGIMILAALSLGYFGFYRGGCVCPIGSIQNVAEAISLGSGVSLVVLGFFLLPLLAALVTGRSFCSGVCPLGAVQDLALLWPLKVPLWLEHVLGLAPWAYLGTAILMAATGSGFLICRYDPFVDFFRLSGPANMLVFGGLVLLVGVFVGRPYCRFVCPYGAILRPLSRLAWRHATITPAECINCRLCEEACPYNAIRAPTPPEGDLPVARGKVALGLALAALPALILGGAWAVAQAAGALSSANYTVRLAGEARLAEYLRGADKLASASPLTVEGRRYSFAEISDRAVVRAVEVARPRVTLWESPPLAPAAALTSPTGRRGLALSADGNAVWALFKDRQVRDGNSEDVYQLAFLDAKTGAVQRREELRLDVNMARAFADTGLSASAIALQARQVEGRIAWGSWALGGFLGLVAGLKLVQLSVRRRRKEFEIDRARCVSCGRCFRYCPVQRPGQVKGTLGVSP
jgi:NosR/NirI family transcriptional regulator, nitrous oxide reductase regulator